LYYLASNALSAQMRVFHGVVCECIVLAESGASSIEADPEAAGDVSVKKVALRAFVATSRTSNRTNISQLKQLAASYADAMIKTETRKNRVERGDSQKRSLPALAREASSLGNEMSTLSVNLSSTSVILERSLGEGARATILPGLAAMLRKDSLSPTEEALGVATAVGAFEAFSKKAAVRFLVHTANSFPTRLSVSVSGSTVRLLDPSGSPVDPALYGVRSGCVLRSGKNYTTISVSGTDITLADSIEVVAGVIIQTQGQRDLEQFIDSTVKVLPVNLFVRPASAVTRTPVRKVTRPEAYKMVSRLVTIAISLTSLTAEATRSAALLGVDVPETQGFLKRVRDFAPTIPQSSVSAADSILEGLRSEGLDHVSRSLTHSDFSILEEDIVSECRRATKTANHVGQLLQCINPKLKL
jgi:hypothetical protein